MPHRPTENPAAGLTRRAFLSAGAAAAAAPFALGGLAAAGAAHAAPAPAAPMAGTRGSAQPNLLFVFADQERYMSALPAGYTLPGHERLRRTGTTFHRHYTSATMCTSSRAVLMTGLQTADNGMFDNVDMPYVKGLSPDLPSIGDMLRKLGYYTAYKGKWHLDAAFDKDEPARPLSREMEGFGFADYTWPGDVVAHTQGGHAFDHLIAGSAVTWMRRVGAPLNAEGKPWALFVSLVNPHDIMYFNADAPGENRQDTGRLMMHAARAPQHAHYARTWNAPLPANLKAPLDAPGRPRAHGEFERAWAYSLGRIPLEQANWQRFSDYYLNCLRAVDTQVETLLVEMDKLNMSGRTITLFTSDHGEMGGAHGLRGKGPFAYEESIHVPLYVVHPDVRGGRDCRALTSHIDLVPTLLAMGGADVARRGALAGRQLPGKDIGPALAAGNAAEVDAVRKTALFTYSGIATNDAEMLRRITDAKAAGQDPKAALKASGYKPDLRKRGSLRTAVDGRYKFTRYFAPVERNRPTTLDELYRDNDLELFDLKTDPQENTNLAARRGPYDALVLGMSAKLESAIKAEIGVDDGREMPAVEGIDWRIDSVDL